MWFVMFFYSIHVMDKVDVHKVNTEIIIDGQLEEWASEWIQIQEEAIDMAMQHDSEYLYVFLKSSDPETTRNVLSRGLEFWFDTKGRKKETFGFRYPIGLMRPGGSRMSRDSSSELQREPIMERLEYMRNDIELLGPEKNQRRRVFLSEMEGLKMHIDLIDRGFVLEIQIPLHEAAFNRPAINIHTNGIVKMTIKSPDTRRKGDGPSGARGMTQGPGMRGGGTSMGGGRSGGTGGPGRGAGRPGRNTGLGMGMTDPIEIKLKLNLLQ